MNSIKDITFKNHLELSPLKPVQVKQPKKDVGYNSSAPRSIDAVALQPMDTLRGAWRFISLETGRLITREQWFTKPLDANRNCTTPGCCGKATLWLRGDEVFRVTARKDEWGEVQSYDGKTGWICNTCRFETKKTESWTIEGITTISRHSVIGANKYKTLEKPSETVKKVMNGRDPKLLMDIHSISDVNKPDIHLSEINGPAHSSDFKK